MVLSEEYLGDPAQTRRVVAAALERGLPDVRYTYTRHRCSSFDEGGYYSVYFGRYASDTEARDACAPMKVLDECYPRQLIEG